MSDTSDRPPRRRPRNGLKIEDDDEDENEPKASPNFYHTPSLTRRRFKLGILGFIHYNIVRSMQKPSSEKKFDIHSEEFLHSLMRKQLKLSVACAASFFIVLLGLPLANYFAPELMATRIGGFTLTWLVLGIAFFPFVWVIAFYFIKRSIALEDEEVKEVAEVKRGEGVQTKSGQVGK